MKQRYKPLKMPEQKKEMSMETVDARSNPTFYVDSKQLEGIKGKKIGDIIEFQAKIKTYTEAEDEPTHATCEVIGVCMDDSPEEMKKENSPKGKRYA